MVSSPSAAIMAVRWRDHGTAVANAYHASSQERVEPAANQGLRTFDLSSPRMTPRAHTENAFFESHGCPAINRGSDHNPPRERHFFVA